MSSGLPEQTMIENAFGAVTNKRVTYMAKKGWFSSGYREDVPLKQVVSVRHVTDRKVFLGLFLIVVGIALLAIIIGIIPLIIGIQFLWGSPTVQVVTAGGTGEPMIGLPWQNKEAEEFTRALRGQLFSQ